MNCVVCASSVEGVFEAKVLSKYDVQYFKCHSCGAIQTEEPYWLAEAYTNAITATDIGLIGRNIHLSEIVYKLIVNNFDYKKRFLDYGGGYGMLVRLLRDKGLDFIRQDIYCENLFAVHHDIEDLAPEDRVFEMTTCFEVFEHTDHPNELLQQLIAQSDNVLISTLIIPDNNINSPADWWYISPETGQHVTFYTLEALEFLAKKHGLNLYSDNESLHLFTRRKLPQNPLRQQRGLKDKITGKLMQYIVPQTIKLPSLISKDLTLAKEKAAGTVNKDD